MLYTTRSVIVTGNLSAVCFSEGDVQGSNGGMLTLGDYDVNHCSATCDWISLTSATYYEFNLQNVRVDNSQVNHAVSRARRSATDTAAISDTGTSLIAGPAEIITSLCTEIGGTFDSANEIVSFYNNTCTIT